LPLKFIFTTLTSGNEQASHRKCVFINICHDLAGATPMRRKLLPILQCIDDIRAVHAGRDAARRYAEAKSNGEAEELIVSSSYCHLLSPRVSSSPSPLHPPSSPSAARTSCSSSPSHPPYRSQCLCTGAGWGIWRRRTARACPATPREGGRGLHDDPRSRLHLPVWAANVWVASERTPFVGDDLTGDYF
jgi:hypothetical protein